MHDDDKRINVESMVSARNKQPYVVLEINKERAQMTIPKAREIAYWLLRATSTAEADAFLVGFMDKEIGIGLPEQGNLLARFRNFQTENAIEQAKED
jgi:hypothetical protein